MKMKKTDDILLKRLLLSVGILLFIRMGTFLPIPGINHGHLAFYIQQHPITKNLVSTFSGNDTFVIGLFTLNIFPFIKELQNRPNIPPFGMVLNGLIAGPSSGYKYRYSYRYRYSYSYKYNYGYGYGYGSDT